MTWQLFNINKLIQLLLPTFLRRTKLIAFLETIATPIDTLYHDTLYKMQHDCRVIYLEKVLNENFTTGYNSMFHLSTRKIYIEDGPEVIRVYIFQNDENKPLFLDVEGQQVYLDKPNEVFYNFIIKVPESLVYDSAKFKEIVDYYRLAGKKYTVQTY